MKTKELTTLDNEYWFQEGPGVRNSQFTDEGIKLLNVGNILKKGGIDLEKTKRFISNKEGQSKYKHFLCDEGDFVIASSGIIFDKDGLLRTRGDFIKKNHLPLCMNTSVIRFKSKNKNNLNYLKHWIQSFDFRIQITKLVTGSAQQNFGPTHLKQIKIKLPSIQDQDRISILMDKVNNQIQNRQLIISKLDELSYSIFNNMFGDPISNKMKWKMGTIKDITIGKPINGIFRKNDDYGSGLPVVWVEDLFRGHHLKLDNARQLKPNKKELEKFSLNYGDLLFCRSSLKLEGIGYNNIYIGKDFEALFECHIIRIRPNTEVIDPIFANFMFRTSAMRLNIIKNSKTSTMTTIDQDGLLRSKIFIPPIKLQKEFSKRYEKIMNEKEKHSINLINDQELYASLLDKNFTLN